MKYDILCESILNELNDYPQLKKMLKKLSDETIWNDAKEELENDFSKNYDDLSDAGEEWAMDAVKKVMHTIDKKYKLDSKDKKILENLLQSYSYILETRGL